jgi:glutathione S-transferase
MTYTLYYSPGACSTSPHVALREAGLPFELVRVDLGKKTYGEGADFLAVNPKGYVPALRLPDGHVLTENAVMIQFIADQVPDKKLAPPAGTFERLRFAEMLVFIATELHKGLSPLYNPKASDELKASIKDRLGKRFAYLGEQVGTKTYLYGDGFTVADGYLFYCLRGWKRIAKEPFPGAYLDGYYARLIERPSVQAVLDAEKLEP